MFCFVLNSLIDLSFVRSIKPYINKFSNKRYIFPLKSKTPSMFKNYKNYLGILYINGYEMDNKSIR